jgi:hypothetical protein
MSGDPISPVDPSLEEERREFLHASVERLETLRLAAEAANEGDLARDIEEREAAGRALLRLEEPGEPVARSSSEAEASRP